MIVPGGSCLALLAGQCAGGWASWVRPSFYTQSGNVGQGGRVVGRRASMSFVSVLHHHQTITSADWIQIIHTHRKSGQSYAIIPHNMVCEVQEVSIFVFCYCERFHVWMGRASLLLSVLWYAAGWGMRQSVQTDAPDTGLPAGDRYHLIVHLYIYTLHNTPHNV